MSPAPLAPLAPGGSDGAVFYLHGPDEFSKDEAARALVEAHLDPATRDFNLDQVRGSDLDLERLTSLLGTPPMMADRRVVLIRGVEALGTQARAREAVLGVARRPPDGLVLILTAVPTQAAFYRDLARLARAREFPFLSESDLPGWLMARAREEFGIELDPDAAVVLSSAFPVEGGVDLGALASELAKLAAVAGEGTGITLETVERAGVRIPRQNRWGWFDRVGERRFLEALRALPTLEAQGETGVGLAVGLAAQLLRIGIAVEEGARGLESRLPPQQRWLARKAVAQGRGWTSGEVGFALRSLRDADDAMKRGAPGAAPLESWLLTLAVRSVQGGRA